MSTLAWMLIGAAAAATCRADGKAEPAGGAPAAIVLPAEVVAYQSALLTAKVAGYLKRITVDKGDKVKAGELIAELEVPELLADRIRDRAQVDVARRVYDRVRKAARTAPDLVTPDTLDSARGQLEVAQAVLDRVQALLGYARITAPFSGTVTARYVDPGAFIPVPTGGNQQGAAIVNLMDFSRVRIQVWVPEASAHWVRPGCRAVFTPTGSPGKRIGAVVTRVSYALERQAHTMLAEIDMTNPGGVLLPGMYLSVRLTPAREAAASGAAGVRLP
jgi:RND family efflux transporter MFP subunit